MSQPQFRVPLRIVLYRHSGKWFAHCLEFDLIGHGFSQGSALRMLASAIFIQAEQSLRFKNQRNLFTPADGKYFAMFAAGKDVRKGEFRVIPKKKKTRHDKTIAPFQFDDWQLRE